MLYVTTIKDVKQNIGSWCRLKRKQENISLDSLGKKLALSPLTILKLEKGENPTLDTLLKVAQYFDALEDINNVLVSKISDIKNTKSLY